MYIKDADKDIIKNLKTRGRLVNQSTLKHSYPFCWRSDTPLIYRAVPSWFVRVTHANEKLLESNSQTYWVPDFVKEKRFGNWLREARDWCISRNRYWGNPIPLWISDDGEEVVCVGSIAELEQLTGQKVTDIHREFIDNLTIPSTTGRGVLRRVTEVFDCWFESGSMPYGQAHYPFENKKEFEDSFPADFIAEGIDQTRGWFYTLVVVSTLLFGKAPFKNLVCNGLVLAKDGQKMSKRKKNFPDPMEVINQYGADALRLYLVNSPAVRAESLRFKEEGVRDILKDVFLPWYNAFKFLIQSVAAWEEKTDERLIIVQNTRKTSDNYMDRWILSFTQSLIKFVEQEMAKYHMYTVLPRLVKFFNQMTNWYVRMNRKRLKGDTGVEDCRKALETLASVIFSVTKVMAPFTPYLTETIYQGMKHMVDLKNEKDSRSVHFLMLPKPKEFLIHKKIETAVSRMQSVIELGRVIRDRKTIPLKYPLKEVVTIAKDQETLEDLASLEKYILEELNVKKLTRTLDKTVYGVRLEAKPDHQSLGRKVGGALKQLTPAISALTDSQIEKFQSEGKIEVAGHVLEEGDLRILYVFDKTGDTPQHYEAHSDGTILVLLDTEPDEEMLNEGVAREVMNRIQRLRKKAKLMPTDDIEIYYKASLKIDQIVKSFTQFIDATIKRPLKPYPVPGGAQVIIQEEMPIKQDAFEITIVQGENYKQEVKAVSQSSSPPSSLSSTASSLSPAPETPGVVPHSGFINIVLCGLEPGQGRSGTQGTIAVTSGGRKLSKTEDLVKGIQSLFGLRGKKVSVFLDAALKKPLENNTDVQSLCSKTLFVTPQSLDKVSPSSNEVVSRPVCHFVNVEGKGEKATLLLENPRGSALSWNQLLAQAKAVLTKASDKINLSHNKSKMSAVEPKDLNSLTTLHGKTIYLL